MSYSRAQKVAAAALSSWLAAAGYTVWFDETIAGGQAWWQAILREIRGSTVVLACMSAEYIASDACSKELGYAMQCNRHVIPINLTDIAPDRGPFELSHAQYLNWHLPVGADETAALSAALRLVRRRPRPLVLPQPPAAPLSAFGRAVDDVLADAVSSPVGSVATWVTHAAAPTTGLALFVARYAGDPFDPTFEMVDQLLDGMLARRAAVDLLPDALGEHAVVRSDGGVAVVVGLGAHGNLRPADLSLALRGGCVALCVDTESGPAPGPVMVSMPNLTGSDELGMRAALHATLEGVAAVATTLARAGVTTSSLRGFEFQWTHEDDAGQCLEELTRLAARGLVQSSVRWERNLARGAGGRPGSSPDADGRWSIVQIRSVPVPDTPEQRALVWGSAPASVVVDRVNVQALIAALARDAPAAGTLTALRDQLVPNEHVVGFLGGGATRLRCDATTFEYPWEAVVFDSLSAAGATVDAALLRDVVTAPGHRRLRSSGPGRTLVIDGARQGSTAANIASLLAASSRDVDTVRGDDRNVLRILFDGNWAVLHLAGALRLEDDDPVVVLGAADDGFVLSAQHISQLPAIPTLVVVDPARNAPGAGDATVAAARWCCGLIETGVRATVAPGLPVAVNAASAFFETFYAAVASGSLYGQAVEAAQRATRDRAARAFQCYGPPALRIL